MLYKQTLVLIPALNEAETLPRVLTTLQKLGLTRLRVIDNGSTDETARLAREAGAEVILEKRRGYGQACWTGLANIPDDIEWLLFCDADGSDDPADVATLFAQASEADFILGNRRATAEGRAALTPV
jgi:glycosyltransferase involved in cell wall biosynthesis